MVAAVSMTHRLGWCLVALVNVDAVKEFQPESSSTLSFDEYMGKYGRTYRLGTLEYEGRRAIFGRRAREVEQLNSREGRTWTAAINHFTDRTDEELAAVNGWKHIHRRDTSAAPVVSASELQEKRVKYPESFDWLRLKTAYPAPDQGGCGSCWAFSAKSTLEANYEIAMGGSRTFSAQDLVACAPNPRHCGGKGGCDGSTVELAFSWAMRAGLETDAGVPYLGTGTECRSAVKALKDADEQYQKSAMLDDDGRLMDVFRTGTAGQAFGLVGFEELATNQLEPLLNALTQKGPVAIAMASGSWFNYGSGLYDCDGQWNVDHALTLYGYGVDNGRKYWLVRNSWGANWGEKGFIRILRTSEVNCGTDKKPADGMTCDNGPSQVKVCGECGMLYDSVMPTFRNSTQSQATSSQAKAVLEELSSKHPRELLRRE